jgi:hypothetical protein
MMMSIQINKGVQHIQKNLEFLFHAMRMRATVAQNELQLNNLFILI